jgi:hypothetical protein
LFFLFLTDGASQVDDAKKKGSTIGRFLRNLGIRKSNRKNAFKQQQGKDGWMDGLLIDGWMDG